MNAALQRAYELEKKGLEFYIGSAMKSKNALAKRTLFSLAREEIDHMMKIDEILSALGDTDKWPEIHVSAPANIEESIREFFNNTGKEVINRNSEDSHIIKKAIELEDESYALYSELSKKSASEHERKFYTELMKQEAEHREALENVYYYLTKTGDWLEKEESRSWNWMNT